MCHVEKKFDKITITVDDIPGTVWLIENNIQNYLPCYDIEKDVIFSVPHIYLYYIEVNEKHKGYGKQLIEHAISVSKERGFKFIYGVVYDGLHPNKFDLLKWYERMGFRKIGLTNKKYRDGSFSGLPVIFMEI